MPRLFFALDLPETVQDDLDELCEGISGARWALATGYHLTLAFLGECGRQEMNEAIDVASSIRVAPFEVQLDGAGTFPRRGELNVLWLGVNREPALLSLQRILATQLRQAGFELEKRKFAPHVTLARVARSPHAAVHDWLRTHVAYRSRPFSVRSFTLFSSVLRSDGPTYLAEERFELRGL